MQTFRGRRACCPPRKIYFDRLCLCSSVSLMFPRLVIHGIRKSWIKTTAWWKVFIFWKTVIQAPYLDKTSSASPFIIQVTCNIRFLFTLVTTYLINENENLFGQGRRPQRMAGWPLAWDVLPYACIIGRQEKVITMYSLSKELLCFGLGNYLHIDTRESQREKHTHITFVITPYKSNH